MRVIKRERVLTDALMRRSVEFFVVLIFLGFEERGTDEYPMI